MRKISFLDWLNTNMDIPVSINKRMAIRAIIRICFPDGCPEHEKLVALFNEKRYEKYQETFLILWSLYCDATNADG